MDSFELNKIAGIVLGTLLLTMGVGFFADIVFSRAPLAKPGYDLPAGEAAPAAGKGGPAPAAVPLGELLAKADPKKGEGGVKACAACHTFDKGGPNRVGPNLYGVVTRPVASVAGFGYSDALKGKGGAWSFEALDAFLTNPKAAVPNNKMAWAGEKDAAKRADIIVYLRSLAETPVALPK
ncbi:MAG: cytochrome c family protein [Methylobacteriaceae bacterium]|nr:cytochrome c family protein [Methylobacteriaceae bacterium]